MPLPTPHANESRDDFISRCMANPTMNSEYPDNSQRAAVCHSQWGRGKILSAKVYGDCEGPFGFPMRSDIAKEIELLVSSLPQECKELGYRRVFETTNDMQFSEGERADISFITTDSVDRDNEVILPNGVDWKQFKKNPVVTFGHKYDELPVGRNMWLKKEERRGRTGWLGKTQYVSRPADWPASAPWFPDAVWHLVSEHSLPGKSIGFIPTEVRPPAENEIKTRPELAGVRRIISKCVALEYAVATVQSNPDTLVVSVAKARQKGIAIPDSLLEELGFVIPTGQTRQQSIMRIESRTYEEVTKPYPNEHAARLHDPGKYDSFARENNKLGEGIHVIYGIKDGKSEIQAIRFDASKFSVEQAKKWLKDHDFQPILFEPATGAHSIPSPSDIKIVTLNDIRKTLQESVNDIVRGIPQMVQDSLDEVRGRV